MTSLCLESCSFKVSSQHWCVYSWPMRFKSEQKGYPFTKGCRNHTRLWVCDVKNEAKAIPGLFILRLKCMCQACELETQTVITLEQFEAGVERCIVILMGRMGRAWVEWRMCTYPVCVSFTHVRFWKPRGGVFRSNFRPWEWQEDIWSNLMESTLTSLHHSSQSLFCCPI